MYRMESFCKTQCRIFIVKLKAKCFLLIEVKWISSLIVVPDVCWVCSDISWKHNFSLNAVFFSFYSHFSNGTNVLWPIWTMTMNLKLKNFQSFSTACKTPHRTSLCLFWRFFFCSIGMKALTVCYVTCHTRACIQKYHRSYSIIVFVCNIFHLILLFALLFALPILTDVIAPSCSQRVKWDKFCAYNSSANHIRKNKKKQF